MGGWLLTVMTARHVFLLAALIPLSLILVAVVVVEDRWEGEMQWDEVCVYVVLCVYIDVIFVAVVLVEDRWEGEMQRDEVYIHTHVCVYIM